MKNIDNKRYNFSYPVRHTAYSDQGFSIIETIVAIAILSVALVAPLTLAQRGLNSSIYAKDQVTAFYLAQEAIEYVHYVRDSNNLYGASQSVDWLSHLDDAAAVWGLDLTASPQVIDCRNDISLCRLTFNVSTGVYGRQTGSGWQNTIFIRTLKIGLSLTVSEDL